MPATSGDPDLAALLADLAMVGPDGLLQRVIRLAGYGVIRRDGRALLCRVTRGYGGAGKWTLPGGGLTFGEPPDAGAVREVEEETGLIARITGVPMILSSTGTWPAMETPVPYHQVRFIYPMEVVGGQERVEVDGSTDAFGWFTEDEIRGLRIVGIVSLALGLPVRPSEEEHVTQSASSFEPSSA